MANKHLRPVKTEQAFNRLDLLMEEMQKAFSEGISQTEEEVVRDFNRALSEYGKILSSPNFDPTTVRQGDVPDPADYNKNLDDLDRDVNALFNELKNAQDLIIENFNYVVSQGDKLSKLSRSVSSKVGDFALFSGDPLKKAIYFKDSFNDASKVDVGSTLISTEQAELNETEGIVTLSVERGTDPNVVPNTVILNDISNGTKGNNHELGAEINDDVDVITDSNPDTWFEYEIVSRRQESTTLRLDLTLVFDDVEIINFIRINPNNFGTQNPISIKTIETSVDGKTYLSIKDDIPIADFLVEDEENVFALAPSTSKFAGQGFYTFTPRQAKFVHVTFTQSNPYIIETTTGEQFRLAIGIRDIETQRLTYATESEVISVPFELSDEIKKVALLANENPSEESDLADIVHQISHDDGATWTQIQPQARSGTEVPEVLNYNLDIDGAIQTDTPIFKIRHRALLTRSPDAFTDNAFGLVDKVASTTDLAQLPITSPTDVRLSKPIADRNVIVLDPSFGSRGKRDPLFSLGVGIGDELEINIPDPIKGNVTRNEIEIYVGGVKWTRVGRVANEGSATLTFEVTDNDTILFGDNTAGKSPAIGSSIQMGLVAERIAPNIDSSHKFELKFPSDGDKTNTVIFRTGQTKRVVSQPLTPGASKVDLKRTNILPNAIESPITFSQQNISEETSFPLSIVDFVDGQTEFTLTTQFSVDLLNGIAYFSQPLSQEFQSNLSYEYDPRIQIDNSLWDFTDTDTERKEITLTDDAYEDINVTEVALVANRRHINLVDTSGIDGQSKIVRKSVSFSTPDAVFPSGLAPQEVSFQDGIVEVSGLKQTTETIPFSIAPAFPPALAGDPYIGTSNIINSADADQPVALAKEGFTFNRVYSPITLGSTDGDFYVDAGSKIITFKHTDDTLRAAPPIYLDIKYYYSEPNVQDAINSSYSVNYDTGDVYFSNLLAATPGNINFKYTNFFVEYNISRIIPRDSYTVNLSTRRITFSEDDVISSVSINNPTRKIIKIIYNTIEQVRESLASLEPYFSPILKDYALKVITRTKLV